jgi:hypothetical protein
MERALHALDDVFQDEEMPEGDVRVQQNNLVERLRERHITRALALALIDDLIARGVFRAGEPFVDLNIVVRFSGEQTDWITPNRYLHTTRECWYGYLAERRAESATPAPESAATTVLPSLDETLSPETTAQKTRRKPLRDKKLEARDKWIYRQCCKGTPHGAIVAELRRIAVKRGWQIVRTKQRIQQIGIRYAQQHDLPLPPSRKNL